MKHKICVVLLTVFLSTIPAFSQTTPAQKASAQFRTAEKAEAALNEKPEANRSRADYLKVIRAYERVYLITPKTSWADNALTSIARLYEVMQEQQRNEILAAWGPSPPDNFFGGTLSSLFTISKKFNIGRRENKAYRSKGKAKSVDIVPGIGPSVDISLDSDFYADKGVMFTEIVTPDRYGNKWSSRRHR